MTGHEDPAKTESALDWQALASFPGTLVVYMGVRRLEAIAQALLRAGRPAEEPAALIERGTLPDQRTVTGTLETIAADAVANDIGAPAIAIFGPVAALREELQWFEHRPLAGRRIAVTRARAQASRLAARLKSLGATVLEVPAIRIVPLDGPAPAAGRLRPRLSHEPEWGAVAVRAPRVGRVRCPCPGVQPGGGDRPRDGGRARRARHPRGRRA